MGVCGIVLRVGYHHDGGALIIQFAEQLHHLHAVLGVEITRRLIGKDDARLAHHGTGYRHTLLLTTRELVGIMLGTMAELYLAQDVEHSLLAFRLADAKIFMCNFAAKI